MKKWIIGLFILLILVITIKYTEPTTIVDQPVPLLDGSTIDSSGTATNSSVADTSVPTTQVDQTFPQAVVAQETISQSLNTETKRILAAYTFEQLGAITIGGYVPNESGEVKISPDGIAAKNVNGDTTFSLDGATGDAIFRGIVTAAGYNVIDENGLISSNAFAFDSVEDDTKFTTTSQTYVDITNMTLTFTLIRPTRVLFLASGIPDIESGTGMAFIYLNLDGSETTGGFTSRLDSSGGKWGPVNCSYVATLAAGTHTIKMQIAAAEVSPSIGVGISNKQLSYLVLGS